MSEEYLNLQHDQVAFPKLGLIFDLDSTAFTIFGVDIQWYGLLITFGMLLAIIFAFSQMKRYGIVADRAIDAIIGGIIGGIVGARTYYVILEWDQYKDNPVDIFNIRLGGLAIYGGIIGAILVGGIVAKLRKVKLLPLLDIVGQGFLIGQCIGRWGNFFNQEAFGCNTDSIFGMTGGRIQSWITSNYANTNCYNNLQVNLDPNMPVHPCFLYESIWCLLGFILLAVTAKKWRKFDGQVFLIYIAWYGLGRSFIEGLRTDSLVIGNIRVSQALSILCVVISVALLIIIGSKVKRLGSDYKLYCETDESKELLMQAKEARLKDKSKSKTNKNIQEKEPEDKNTEKSKDSQIDENSQNNADNANNINNETADADKNKEE